jgi:hypothetical protein
LLIEDDWTCRAGIRSTVAASALGLRWRLVFAMLAENESAGKIVLLCVRADARAGDGLR